MKANKITLKKMRIEYLERIAGTLEYEIKSNRDNLENAKENLALTLTKMGMSMNMNIVFSM